LAADLPTGLVPVPSPTSDETFYCTDEAEAEKIAGCFRDEPKCEAALDVAVKNTVKDVNHIPWTISAVLAAFIAGMVAKNNIH
jgi:hypothetical protein